jgi:hypothetical protein
MAHMAGLFSPDDMSKWPAIDESNPAYQRDMAALQARGSGEGGHDHGSNGNHGSSGTQDAHAGH